MHPKKTDETDQQALSSSFTFEPFADLFLALNIACAIYTVKWFKEEGWKYLCRYLSLFVLLYNTKFINNLKFSFILIKKKKLIYCPIFFDLQNHPTFHSEERLANLVRRRECFVGLSILCLCLCLTLMVLFITATFRWTCRRPCWRRTPAVCLVSGWPPASRRRASNPTLSSAARSPSPGQPSPPQRSSYTDQQPVSVLLQHPHHESLIFLYI